MAFLIADVARLLRRSFDRRVQALGLTQVQWRAIARLTREPGLKQTELAERLEVKPITLTRLIDRMEAAGWVERRGDPHDRRVVRLYVTARTKPLVAQMRARVDDVLAEALAGVPKSDRRQLASSLARIKRNLTGVECAPNEDDDG